MSRDPQGGTPMPAQIGIIACSEPTPSDTPSVTLVGFDVGLANLGWARAEMTAAGLRFVAAGVWRTKPTARKRGIRKADSDTERVLGLAANVLALLDAARPVAVCLESGALPHGRVRPSVIAGISRVRGVIDALCHVARVATVEDSPQRLKVATAGAANASKAEVQAALEHRHPELRALLPVGSTADHAADACAAIVACSSDAAVLAALKARAA